MGREKPCYIMGKNQFSKVCGIYFQSTVLHTQYKICEENQQRYKFDTLNCTNQAKLHQQERK